MLVAYSILLLVSFEHKPPLLISLVSDCPHTILWGIHLILTAWGVVAVGQGTLARYGVLAVVLLFLGILAAILVRVERARRPIPLGSEEPTAADVGEHQEVT